jgi:RNA polymerase sigma-70 factor (ECF subfamily)
MRARHRFGVLAVASFCGVPDAAAAYRELAAAVLGYLRASGAADAEDILGEVFLQVARDLPGFRDADDPEARRRWVFTIARHRVVDAARRARRQPAVVPGDVPERAAPPLEDDIDPVLVAALRFLTDDQREVLALRFVADLALDDVAVLMGRSVGAVKALQHRALENLRSAVSPAAPPTL